MFLAMLGNQDELVPRYECHIAINRGSGPGKISVPSRLKVAPNGAVRASVAFWKLVLAFHFTPSSLKTIKMKKNNDETVFYNHHR